MHHSMKLRQRIGVLLWALLFILLVFGEVSHSVGLDVDLQGDKLTLNAERAAPQEILDALRKKP